MRKESEDTRTTGSIHGSREGPPIKAAEVGDALHPAIKERHLTRQRLVEENRGRGGGG